MQTSNNFTNVHASSIALRQIAAIRVRCRDFRLIPSDRF